MTLNNLLFITYFNTLIHSYKYFIDLRLDKYVFPNLMNTCEFALKTDYQSAVINNGKLLNINILIGKPPLSLQTKISSYP